MENISKALTMAAAIIIGVILLSVMIHGYTNISKLYLTEEESKQTEQLAVFNKDYESYNRKLLLGLDVITLMNKVLDNNEKYDDDPYYTINIEFEMVEVGSTATLPVGVYDLEDYNTSIKNNNTVFDNLKTDIFNCTEITYNDKSGRVNFMRFVQRPYDKIVY